MNSPLEKKSLSSEAVQRARKLLGLGECATLSEIKNAFRDMAKKYHPDKCRGDKKDCENMMRKLNEAHETILAFLSGYRYCFDQKPSEEEEYWEDFRERFYKDFII
jgi:DnaJ-class molecular chaperone